MSVAQRAKSIPNEYSLELNVEYSGVKETLATPSTPGIANSNYHCTLTTLKLNPYELPKRMERCQ